MSTDWILAGAATVAAILSLVSLLLTNSRPICRWIIERVANSSCDMLYDMVVREKSGKAEKIEGDLLDQKEHLEAKKIKEHHRHEEWLKELEIDEELKKDQAVKEALINLKNAIKAVESAGGQIKFLPPEEHLQSEPQEPDKNHKSDKHRKGRVSVKALAYIVPAIVTLAFVGTFLALEIMNNGDPEYQCSETFRASFLIIIGYYFGMGTTTVASNVDDE